jgi:hypothetical protein
VDDNLNTPKGSGPFREFGILPDDVEAPSGTIRAYFSAFQIFGQYLGIGLLSGAGIGMAILFVFTLPVPQNILASMGIFACFAFLVYVVTKNDYCWIELDGTTIRAKHLYTRRIVAREIHEIDELITMVLPATKVSVHITNALLGRIRGIRIRFHDRLTSLPVWRADPKMLNGQELIEGVIYRMSEDRKLDAEIVELQGKPFVRRIYAKQPINP